jgi:uncharacterized membrane protein YcaP (DUF421 family)
MEPEVRAFLVRIMQSLSMTMVFLLINMTIGIYFNFAFFDDTPSLGNYIYGIFLIASFILLIVYLKRKWKGFEEIENI